MPNADPSADHRATTRGPCNSNGRTKETRLWSATTPKSWKRDILVRVSMSMVTSSPSHSHKIRPAGSPATKHTRQMSDSLASNGETSPTKRRISVSDRHDSILSDGDAEHVRMHTRQHLHQRFTLEDGSEVKVRNSVVVILPKIDKFLQLTQLHLGRTKEKEPERLRGRSVPVTIIESPTKETNL